MTAERPCPVWTRTARGLTCHDHDRERVEGRLATLPRPWRRHLVAEYSYRYRRSGRRLANTWLRELQEAAAVRPLAGIELTAGDDVLRDRAERLAARCEQLQLDAAIGVAQWHGIAPPDLGAHDEAAAHARLSCRRWWRRQLRRTHGRTVEDIGRRAGVARLGRDLYTTEAGVIRRRQQHARNRALLESLIAINDDGEFCNLQELVERTNANPKIRRGELMTRIAGFEQIARDSAHAGEFLTITCPSRFHASRVIKGQHRAEPNPKYDGSTPREAQAYLCKVWAKARAQLAREGIRPYGFRVCEPQQDGTPHWHLLLFVPAPQADRLAAIIEEHACKADAGELTTDARREARFKRVKIDWRRGSAAGYIAKYIAKNIDGYGIEQDLFGNDPKAAAARVDAWASTWGIRQFQQIGGPSVVVWRELRRLKGDTTGTAQQLRAAITAADAGEWADYIRAQGGPTMPRHAQPIRALTKYDASAGCYGEPKGDRIVGIECGRQAVITRTQQWVIDWARGENAGIGVKSGGAGAVSDSSGGPDMENRRADGSHRRPDNNVDGMSPDCGERAVYVAAAEKEKHLLAGDSRPWSSVNNCTAPPLSSDELRRIDEEFGRPWDQSGGGRECMQRMR